MGRIMSRIGRLFARKHGDKLGILTLRERAVAEAAQSALFEMRELEPRVLLTFIAQMSAPPTGVNNTT